MTPRSVFILLISFTTACLLSSCQAAAQSAVDAPTPAPNRVSAAPRLQPKPTATAAQPEPEQLPTEAPPTVLFRENFDSLTTCFNLRSNDEGASLGIEAGAYRMRVEGMNGFDSRCTDSFDNFVLEFDLTMLEGGAHSLFGLMFRIDLGSSYNIYFSAEDDFCWDYFDLDQNRYTELAGCWGRLPAGFIPGETVRIQVIASGENMALRIDEEVITTIYDRSGDDGTFGFFVINNGPGTTEIQIDNIQIRELTLQDIGVFRPDQTGF